MLLRCEKDTWRRGGICDGKRSENFTANCTIHLCLL